MVKRTKTPSRQRGYLLGREAFASISAIEGIVLTPGMREDFREFDARGLSPEERREALKRKYGRQR